MSKQQISELKKLAREQELEVIEHSSGHVMVIGGAVNVTWWPDSRRMTAYAERAPKGRSYSTPKIVVNMALGKTK